MSRALSRYAPLHHAPFLQLTLPQETIGSVTGNQAWSSSGATDKAAGVEAMQAASERRDPARDGFGGVEETAGRLAGCEGMVREGAESKRPE
jgi:uncharacterized protein YjbJ (UPF0337 family)